jgi:hypothetical protein
MAQVDTPTAERQWFIVGRWQEYEGEGRANLLRIVAIGAFYAVQLAYFYQLAEPTAQQVQFHRSATALAVAWSLASLAVLLCLRRRVFPAVLKFLSVGADIVMLTALASLGSGPHSPLVFVYFLVIVLAGVRFSLLLVWFATLGSIAGYLTLVGLADKDGWFNATHVVEPIEQLVMLLSLALTGIMLGQVIRRVRGLANEYARRIGAAAKPSS